MNIKVHHLNCGTMCPLCQRLMNSRDGSWTAPGELVCHCLLIETADTLVMVDTGMGLHDIKEPKRRLGALQPTIFRPRLAVEETAIHQVRELGYDPRDVRHIIPTHLDVDHAGGLADFPWAKVHVLQPELDQVQKPTRRDRMRFQSAQFAHGPHWVVHSLAHSMSGESWFDFRGLRPLPEVAADILMIPLLGHTKGHVGIAVRNGDKWLLHCGDAYYHHSQVTATPEVPAGLAFFQSVIAAIPEQRVHNLEKLRQLAINHSDEVELFCAHSPDELARYTAIPH